MANEKEIKEPKNDTPASVPFEQYQQVVYERDLYKEMVVSLNVDIFWLKRNASRK